MLRALFLSLDECNLCVCVLAMGHSGDSIKNGPSSKRKWGPALTISVPHTLSLSLWRLWIYFDLRHCVVCRVFFFFATISCHKSRTDAMLKVGAKQISPASFKEGANLSIRIDRSC